VRHRTREKYQRNQADRLRKAYKEGKQQVSVNLTLSMGFIDAHTSFVPARRACCLQRQQRFSLTRRPRARYDSLEQALSLRRMRGGGRYLARWNSTKMRTESCPVARPPLRGTVPVHVSFWTILRLSKRFAIFLRLHVPSLWVQGRMAPRPDRCVKVVA